MKFKDYIKEKEDKEVGFKGWPNGGSGKSLKDWVKTFADNHDGLMPKEEGWFDACVDAMKDEEGFNQSRAQKFCAALKDEYLDKENGRGED